MERPQSPMFGTVSRIVGTTIEAKGLMASLGTICLIEANGGQELEAQVVEDQKQLDAAVAGFSAIFFCKTSTMPRRGPYEKDTVEMTEI